MQQKGTGKNNTADPTGFDFTGNMHLLIADIARTHPVFEHINPSNLLVAISPSNGKKSGVIAKLRPLRFEGGAKTRIVRGIEFAAPEITIKGNEILYIIYFHLPRYQNHDDKKSKLSTVLHELYHISPEFNGDVRRFSGKNYAHSNSKKDYDALIQTLTEEYLKITSKQELSAFLKYKYGELRRKYGAVCGDMIRISRGRPLNQKKINR